jgi:ligand-binding sensor domain-containing protein
MAVAAFLLVASALPAAAQRMPVTTSTGVHGLSHEYVFDLLSDSRGFLWFATQDGVSRYDGARFTTYHRREGVPDQAINSILETRDGTIWVTTKALHSALSTPHSALQSRRLAFHALAAIVTAARAAMTPAG